MRKKNLVVVVLGLLLVSVAILPIIVGASPLSQGLTESKLQEAPTRPPLEPPSDTGFVPLSMDLSHLKGDRMPPGVNLSDLPSRWDWREQGIDTKVQDQGDCGACYAFAALANIESMLQKAGDGDFDLSENNAKECSYREINNILGGASCSGGNYFIVADLLSKGGTVLEADDRYVPRDVECKTSPYQKTLLGWEVISEDTIPSPEVLKAHVQNGPMYTSVYVGDIFDRGWQREFVNFNGSYTLYHPGGRTPNHNVLIVGWDDNLPHAGGKGAWICKNSWGTDWGGTCGYGTERGYFTIAYGSANIGMYSSTIYAWQDYDPHSNVMFYDEAGLTGWGCRDSTTCWGLSKFIPPSGNITWVEFWTTDVTVDIDVFIYDNFDGTAPSNLLWSSLDHSFNKAGYHGVEVDPPLAATEGDDIVVVVKFTNEGFMNPVAADDKGPHETGRTFISCNGSDWYDLGVGKQDDVAIRLRISGVIPPTSTPTPMPTGTPTPTWTPLVGIKVWLPLCLKNAAPAPTPTNTPTWTPTFTPVPSTSTPTTTPTRPAPTPTSTPTVPAGTNVYVTNSTTFVPYPGSNSIYLVGEVHNNSSVSVGFVRINATFYDEAGRVVGEGFIYACLHHLAPGMTSPFINIFSNLAGSGWVRYELHVTWQTTNYTPLAMEVSNVRDFFDDQDAFHVTGQVRNQYDRRLSNIGACVAMYDATGETIIIGVWWDDVAALDPGGTDSFDVEVYFWKYKPDQSMVSSYSLFVYNEYELVLSLDQENLHQQARKKASELAAQMQADREAQVNYVR